ncbi:unnamed protein product, partial [Gongylonema pulchrum]|uniref:Uncharacterized protein n=1 Tax=Gongylonema pulchrum TaxID=637853 RepID=A0A183D9K3_9BILA
MMEVRDLNRKIDKLNRFCLQTEQAMTHLEALRIVARTEAEITALKSDLKKEKTRINHFLKFENNSPDGAALSSSILNQDEFRRQDQFDAERERLEEVALEEFLIIIGAQKAIQPHLEVENSSRKSRRTNQYLSVYDQFLI